MGDLRPRLLEAVLSDLSASFDFFPFLPPNRPPKMPFFFFLPSPFSGAGVGGAIDGLDFMDPGVVVGGSSTSWPLPVSTFMTRDAGGLGADSCACWSKEV